MKFSEYKYERIEFEDIKNDYSKYLNDLKKANNSKEFMDVFKKINILRSHISTMQTLCSIRHSIDPSDKYYDEENDYWDDTSPKIQEYETEFFKICINVPFRNELDIPETFFKLGEYSLKAFNPIIIEDLQKENKLASEYGKLKASAKINFDGEEYNLASIQKKMVDSNRDIRKRAYQAYCKFFEDNENKFDDIFDKLVKVRDEMAKKLGFNSFTELGYIRMNRFDYDEKMVANYRKQVVDEIVPIVNEIHKQQAKRIGVEQLECYDVDYMFKSGNPKPIGDEEYLVNQALKMYTEMSNETAEYFKVMVENELFDLSSKPNKEMGGYCTDLFDYKVPFIFSNFNGTEGDVNVLTHEAGHGLQSYLATREINIPDVCWPTLETCEIHSMSMEFFAFPWMENFFGKDSDKYKYSQLAGTLLFLPYGCLIDHFQHEVYNHPEMTPVQRKEVFRKLEKTYKPDIDYKDFAPFNKGGFFYKQGHVFESPFYYIDYTLAQVCALQFYKRFLENDKNYFADYINICKAGGTKSFVATVKLAGLKSPFEDGCLKEIANIMNDELVKMSNKNFD